MTAAPDPWDMDWPKVSLLTRLHWWLSDWAWEARLLGRRMKDIVVARLRRAPIKQTSAPPQFNLEAHRTAVTALIAHALSEGMSLGEYVQLAEPEVRLGARHGELADAACLAGLLMHKAVWLNGEGNDPAGSVEAALEGAVILGRVALRGFDPAAEHYLQLRAEAPVSLLRQADKLIADEDAPLLPEPEVIAILAANVTGAVQTVH